MHIDIHPKVEGIAAGRLLDFAAALAADKNVDADQLPALVEQEAAWARRTPHLNGQTKAYEVSMRLLADLRALKWRVRADRFGIELVSPRRPRAGKGGADFATASKIRLRDELRPVLASQFDARHVRSFIADCEAPPPGKNNRRSVRLLVADDFRSRPAAPPRRRERLVRAFRSEGRPRIPRRGRRRESRRLRSLPIDRAGLASPAHSYGSLARK